jgi:hypothetical protein
MADLMESWIEVENGRWNDFSSWMRKSSNGNKNGEMNRIWEHAMLLKTYDFMSQNRKTCKIGLKTRKPVKLGQTRSNSYKLGPTC